MELSERLLALRRGRGLSQERLAEELNVSRQAVSKWETGQSVPDLDKLLGSAPKTLEQPTVGEPGEKPEKAQSVFFALREDKWFPTCWHTMVWGILLAAATCFLTKVVQWMDMQSGSAFTFAMEYLNHFPLNVMLWLSAVLAALGALGVGYCVFCAQRRRKETKPPENDSTGC